MDGATPRVPRPAVLLDALWYANVVQPVEAQRTEPQLVSQSRPGPTGAGFTRSRRPYPRAQAI